MTDQTVAPPATNTDPQKTEKAKTSYAVLEVIDAQIATEQGGTETVEVLRFVTWADAVGSAAAIRALKKEGKFVAIPSRSFTTVTVKTETKTVLKLT